MSAKRKVQRVVFQPAAYRGLQRGINQIVDAIRPTLGPRPRFVAMDRGLRDKAPELLDSGGLIARRIVALPDRDADMGAMLLRSLLWRLHEQVGDGTATAAVLFQSIYNQGVRHLAAGGNAMRLRRHLEGGMGVILAQLSGMVRPVEGQTQLARIAAALCYDTRLAKVLGEVFDTIGEYGQLEIREGQDRELEREYVEGNYWKGGVLSRQMIADRKTLKTNIENAAVLISDLTVENPEELQTVIELAAGTGAQALLIIAGQFSDTVLTALSARRDLDKLNVVAVKTPGLTIDEQIGALEDLSVLTGGRPVLRIAGQSLGSISQADLGRARRAWADRFYFGIVGGGGNPRLLRQHIAQLRAAFKNAPAQSVRAILQQRIGKLIGGSATLWVGAATPTEISTRKELAERTAAALRGAVLEGVLPGGGVALIDCCAVLHKMLKQSSEPEEQAAYRILIRALEEPLRTIIGNAGDEPARIMAKIKLAGSGYGFDVVSGQVVKVAEAGILDVATVLKAAVHGAIASAALSLTIEVLIHHKQPTVVLTPG